MGQPDRSLRTRSFARSLPRAVRDPRKPSATQFSTRHRQSEERGFGPVIGSGTAVAARTRNDEVHRHDRVEGRLQPHVPGTSGTRRHGDRPGAVVSNSCVCRRPWASGNVIALDVRDPEQISRNASPTHASICIPSPKVVIANFPHNPTATCIEPRLFFVELVRLAKKYEFLVISDFAYAGPSATTATQAPSFLATPGANRRGS